MQISVSGDTSFKRFAAGIDRATGPAWDRHMERGLKESAEDLGHAVHAATDIYLPSGYEQAFRASSRFTVELNRPLRKATVVYFATSRAGRREVVRLNRGELRHPVWGRVRQLKAGGKYTKKPGNMRGGVYCNPWSVTDIRRGFFSEPVALASPRAVKRLDTALGRALAEVNKP